MPETQFSSVIQRIINCQIGSSIRFFDSGPAALGGCFLECNLIIICQFNNHKAEVVK